jgi:hypothetical protein
MEPGCGSGSFTLWYPGSGILRINRSPAISGLLFLSVWWYFGAEMGWTPNAILSAKGCGGLLVVVATRYPSTERNKERAMSSTRSFWDILSTADAQIVMDTH